MEFSVEGLMQLGLIMFVLMIAVGLATLILFRALWWMIWKE